GGEPLGQHRHLVGDLADGDRPRDCDGCPLARGAVAAQSSLTMQKIVTLLTDFGTIDGYVAEMKGVILSAAPQATIVDVTHDIPPQDVERARLVVARMWRRFPAGTIHVVVVDPGVGSARAGLCIESDGRYLVGPDNGVLSPALLIPTARAVE